MELQTVINIALGGMATLALWILNSLKDSLHALSKSDMELANKVQSIEVLVAGAYVRRDEVERLSIALFAKLDKIEAKLDSKADKAACDKIHLSVRT